MWQKFNAKRVPEGGSAHNFSRKKKCIKKFLVLIPASNPQHVDKRLIILSVI